MQTAADWGAVTDEYEYEDGRKDFNEVSDVAPVRWEYSVIISEPTAFDAITESSVYHDFYNAVRRSQPFNFTDKFGVIWEDVRVESYERIHDAHKSWTIFVNFVLVSYRGISSNLTFDAGDEDDINNTTIDGGSL